MEEEGYREEEYCEGGGGMAAAVASSSSGGRATSSPIAIGGSSSWSTRGGGRGGVRGDGGGGGDELSLATTDTAGSITTEGTPVAELMSSSYSGQRYHRSLPLPHAPRLSYRRASDTDSLLSSIPPMTLPESASNRSLDDNHHDHQHHHEEDQSSAEEHSNAPQHYGSLRTHLHRMNSGLRRTTNAAASLNGTNNPPQPPPHMSSSFSTTTSYMDRYRSGGLHTSAHHQHSTRTNTTTNTKSSRTAATGRRRGAGAAGEAPAATPCSLPTYMDSDREAVRQRWDETVMRRRRDLHRATRNKVPNLGRTTTNNDDTDDEDDDDHHANNQHWTDADMNGGTAHADHDDDVVGQEEEGDQAAAAERLGASFTAMSILTMSRQLGKSLDTSFSPEELEEGAAAMRGGKQQPSQQQQQQQQQRRGEGDALAVREETKSRGIGASLMNAQQQQHELDQTRCLPPSRQDHREEQEDKNRNYVRHGEEDEVDEYGNEEDDDDGVVEAFDLDFE